MSERSKGDTSSSTSAPPASARVVKNPLLSASVTGLTFDDFQNKPLLLPAAPPIIHPVPVISSRESTPLVTVGKLSDIDTENLSEVNLNDVSATTTLNTTDPSDENSNTLVEPSTQADNSILSQAASSFSQLPSVASSVFSTFSKKFNSSSGRDDINSNPSPSLDIQPFTTQFVSQAPPPTAFGNQEQKQQQQSELGQKEPQIPIDPPTFYSPTEVATLPSGVPCPSIASGQNTYRISARKKIYAPIPGLSSSHQEQNFPPATASFLPPIGFEVSPVPVYPEQTTINKPEERKGGLFSLSNLVPTVPNVLQNLSGLVQSATGSLSQKSQESLQQSVDNFGPFQVETSGQAPPTFYPTANRVDFFGADQTSQQAPSYQPPPPVNFFTPPVAASAQSVSGHIFVGEALTEEKPDTNLFAAIPPQLLIPSAQPSSSATLFTELPPKSTTPEVKPAQDTFVAPQLPVAPPSVKPPSGGPPSTSFRLQKGTRLYKSPFAAATSEYQQQPTSECPPPPQGIIPPSQATTEGFNLFNPLKPTRETVSPLILAPPPVAEGTSITPAQEEQAPVSIAEVFQPFQVASQENTFSNLLTNQPLPTPLEIESRRSPKQPTPPLSSVQELATPNPSAIKPVNVSETESRDKQESLNPVQLPLQQQLDLGQPTLLPPPPAATFGNATPSKETANFPPPPPQHLFQNKLNSNPYRKELQSHHTQLPAPASLSTIFTPKDQDIDLFKHFAGGAVNPLPEVPPCIAAFFNPPSAGDVLINQAKPPTSAVVSETPVVFEKLPPPILPSAIEEIPKSPPKVDTQPTALTSTIFTPIPAAPIESNSTPALETTILPEGTPLFTQSKTLVESQLKEDPEENRATPTPASKLVSFFKGDSPPSDPFAAAYSKELLTRSESQDASKPDQSAASVPAASAKIASPLKSQENSEPQQSVSNIFTSFFEQAAPAAVTPVINQPSLPDPTSFFDSFGPVPSVGVDAAPPEDPNSQRIQNFFNNPPPKDLDPVGDLNYNLVGSGLSVKNLQTRSLTPASNLAEPPSSSCSEFSELNSSLSAANRQARVPAEQDSNKVSPEEEVVFEAPDNQELPEEIINEIKMANSTALESSNPTNVVYKPAVKHWFFKRKLDDKHIWIPFSYFDSTVLEDAFLLGDNGPNLVAVEGGRYDVNISERIKAPVYWEGEPIEVKRCSWFYKASDSKYVPYEEEIADLLEEEYRKAYDNCEWHKKIPISATDMVQFHGPTVIVHFQQQQQVDSWGGSTLDSESLFSYIQQQTNSRPRVVKRDLEDFKIEDGESHKVDHLLYMVHGIGSACDLKMRTVEEVVDEFRSIALQLVQSHYKNSVENGLVGRVEVLPVSWHSELHSDELGIDEKLKSITLESIPKLRNFTNDTLLDILFYTSPMFCQRIMNTVTASMNSIFIKYKQRNPHFNGGVSLAGHSLGSLILFDLLCHQRPLKECEEQNMENPDEITPGFPVDSDQLNEDAAKHISYKMGPAGTGQPFISYPQLIFQPKKFFALGSPIGMFVTIRGIDKLGLEFRLPTCPGFYNIFHPYDPVAYRLEALVNPDMNGIPPVLIPHHKGRKRMHLELKETMSRVGADLKQRFFDTFKTTFDSVSFLTPKPKNEHKEMEKEVDKVLELQAHQEHQGASTSRSRADSNSTNQSDPDVIEIDFPLGKLNDSKRVDYVLQEAPLEFFNEYLFALSSHVCYWESEDTILFVMKEIYNGIGFSPDSQVPQQTMTIERPSSRNSMTQSPTS